MSDLTAAVNAAYDTEGMTLREQFEMGIISAAEYAGDLADAAHERDKYGDEW